MPFRVGRTVRPPRTARRRHRRRRAPGRSCRPPDMCSPSGRGARRCRRHSVAAARAGGSSPGSVCSCRCSG
eukprot:3756144-Lingulodinium_polyedra.AAC.1